MSKCDGLRPIVKNSRTMRPCRNLYVVTNVIGKRHHVGQFTPYDEQADEENRDASRQKINISI